MISSIRNIIHKRPKDKLNHQSLSSPKQDQDQGQEQQDKQYQKRRAQSLPNKLSYGTLTAASSSSTLSDSDREELFSIRTSPPGNLLPSYYMYRDILHYKVNEVVPPPPNYSSTDDSDSDVESRASITNDDNSVCQKLLSLNHIGASEKPDAFFEECIKANIVLDKDDNYEYTQGDNITGMLTLTNLKNLKVDIDKVFIFLEGINRTYTFEEKVFLSIVDYELFTDSQKDNGYGGTGIRLKMQGDKFKRGFKFTIPYYLLESQCKHKIKNHYLLPPSLKSLAGGGVSRVIYRVSCYVLKYNHQLRKNIKIGSSNKDIQFIPKDELIDEVCDINYDALLNRLHDNLTYIDKTKFEDLYQLLQVKDLSNKLVLSKEGGSGQESIEITTPLLTIPYTRKTPLKVNEKLFIPIDFEKLSSPIKSINVELMVVTGMSTTKIPIFISPNMLFESFSNLAYEQIIKAPILNIINNFTKYSLDFDYAELCDLTKIYLQYTPVRIDNVNIDKNGILFDLNQMFIKEQNKTKKYGQEFNLVPNFQNCYNFREYYIKLEFEITGNFTNNAKKKKKEKNKFTINVPLKVTSK